MDGNEVLDIGRQAMTMLIFVAGPVMMIGLAIGLVVSVFQTLTQIQEMTLTFVPKIIAVFAALVMLFPYMGTQLAEFFQNLLDIIIATS